MDGGLRGGNVTALQTAAFWMRLFSWRVKGFGSAGLSFVLGNAMENSVCKNVKNYKNSS